MKVGDLVQNIHGLYPFNMGLIIEISKPQLSNPHGCPYRVCWFNDYEASWMREDWLKLL